MLDAAECTAEFAALRAPMGLNALIVV